MELKRAFRHPRKFVRHLFGLDRIRWIENNTGLLQRQYASYEQYLAHQRSKLDTIQKRKGSNWLQRYVSAFQAVLLQRLRSFAIVKPSMRVLCLAARLGSEVRAFKELGCFAVGIDLNPGAANPHVLHGDFHHLEFPDSCVDLVYSNSIDHAFDLKILVAEIRRVTTPEGLALIEVASQSDEGGSRPGRYEALAWKDWKEVQKIFLESGFIQQHVCNFDEPWPGVAMVLKKH